MVTMCSIIQNEEQYVERFIRYHAPFFKHIILLDGGSIDGTIDIIKSLKKEYPYIELYKRKFNGHFGDQKNACISMAKTPWTFVIDADEIVDDTLLKNLDTLVSKDFIECYAIARRNLIDDEDTGVFPDYQFRLFRSFCRYILPVHEELVGYNHLRRCYIDCEGGTILHNKPRARQNRQDALYERLIDEYPDLLRYDTDTDMNFICRQCGGEMSMFIEKLPDDFRLTCKSCGITDEVKRV